MSNTSDSSSSASASTPPSTPPSTWIKRVLVGVVVLIALVYGAIFFYANVINDSPDALNSDDLSAALEPSAETTIDGGTAAPDATLPPDTEEATLPPDTEPTNTEPTNIEPANTESAAPAADGFDGEWAPTTASEFGYRVDEVLGGVNVTAVGRSSEIEGSLIIDGTTASIEATVQVESIVSDDGRRDGQFRGRIMDVDNFPTATFRTTELIEFGAIPADGAQVTATAVGELTLKGVTLPVTLEVTAQASVSSIGVLGNIPITFTDYGIDNPSNAGVSLEDVGIVEFVLVFERS